MFPSLSRYVPICSAFGKQFSYNVPLSVFSAPAQFEVCLSLPQIPQNYPPISHSLVLYIVYTIMQVKANKLNAVLGRQYLVEDVEAPEEEGAGKLHLICAALCAPGMTRRISFKKYKEKLESVAREASIKVNTISRETK